MAIHIGHVSFGSKLLRLAAGQLPLQCPGCQCEVIADVYPVKETVTIMGATFDSKTLGYFGRCRLCGLLFDTQKKPPAAFESVGLLRILQVSNKVAPDWDRVRASLFNAIQQDLQVQKEEQVMTVLLMGSIVMTIGSGLVYYMNYASFPSLSKFALLFGLPMGMMLLVTRSILLRVRHRASVSPFIRRFLEQSHQSPMSLIEDAHRLSRDGARIAALIEKITHS